MVWDLFPDGLAGGRTLPVPLPPGQLVVPDADFSDCDRPVLWLSDGPAPLGLWSQLRAGHARSGLWPLLLGGLGDHDESRPWVVGELSPDHKSATEDHDAGALLAGWWQEHTAIEDDDVLGPDERIEVTAPFGQRWPGRLGRLAALAAPDVVADQVSDQLLADQPHMRLGLVATDRGADALAVTGWDGPCEYLDGGELSAVLRDWEQRFGTRVVGAEYATLHLSVAAPPTTMEDSLRVAAEHFALCPDIVWQGHDTLAACAEWLVGRSHWSFWWD